MKRCRVSYRDSRGIEHAVELEASSLYEAVGPAKDRFRRGEHLLQPKGLYEFTVEPRGLTAQHRLTRNIFDEWLRRLGGTPARAVVSRPPITGTATVKHPAFSRVVRAVSATSCRLFAKRESTSGLAVNRPQS